MLPCPIADWLKDQPTGPLHQIDEIDWLLNVRRWLFDTKRIWTDARELVLLLGF